MFKTPNFDTFDFQMCFAPQPRTLFSTSERQKVVRTHQFFTLLTWKCASRHNGVHFLNISTSKSGLRPWVFDTFALEMCFAPQQPALFRHLNIQKWSEDGVVCTFWLGNVLHATTACTFSTSQLPRVVWEWCVLYILMWTCVSLFRHLKFEKWSDVGVLCTFWLGNVLRATAARTFSTSQLPKVAWEWCALYILTWKCASRHNGVQFFISHLARRLRTRRFSEPTFRPPRATNHCKNTVNRDFPTFSRTCIFFLLTLSLLCSSHFLASPLWLFPPLLFHVSIPVVPHKAVAEVSE